MLQSAVVQEVERWPHTPNAVGLNPSAAVDCLPQPADNSKEVLIYHEKSWWFGVHNNRRSI